VNYRLSAQERDRHDRMECSDACPACAQVEAHEPPERGGREYDITPDYEETY
jgi:hypothetical protein